MRPPWPGSPPGRGGIISASSSLVLFLKAFPGPAADIRCAGERADPAELCSQASRHGLAGLVWEELRLAGVELPTNVESSLRRHALASKLSATRDLALLDELIPALAKQGVIPVLLKGFALASRIYPRPSDRLSTDLDLLVRSSDQDRAALALTEAGFSNDSALESPPSRFEHQRLFFRDHATIELHLQALPGYPTDADALWAASRPSELRGHRVRYLEPVEELIYLAAHGAHHLFSRLSWSMDLKLFIQKHADLDWELVRERCRRSGLRGPTSFALRIARDFLGAEVPPEAFSLEQPSAIRSKAAQWLFSERRLGDAYVTAHRWAWLAAKATVTDRPSDLIKLGLHRLRGGG